MLFFLNGDGTMTRQDNTRIFQGSNNATKITVVAPFGAPSALQIAFQLPSGLWTQSYLMAYRGEFMGVNPNGAQLATGVYAYDILLPYSVTEFVGTCGIAIRVVNETTQVVLATYTADFIIEESVLPSPPDGMTPDEFNELYTLLSSYYTQNQAVLQQNEELISTIQGDYNSVILRLDAVEADIAALQQQTTNPLLGDFTINQQTGEGVKFYKDGTTQSFEVPFAQYISTVNRKDFLTAVTFTAANWSEVGDGTYSLSLTSAQTGRTNSQYLVAIEELVGGEYVQRAYAIDKNADGSIVVSGVTTPFDGRIITIASGGAGTVWHEGIEITGTGQQTSTDEDLRAVAAVGDFYLNTDNGNAYKCVAVTDTESVWDYLLNLKGVPGDPATNIVQSVNGKIGVVVLSVEDIVGLVSALAGKVDTSELGVPSGVATLDGNGKVPLSQINDSVLGQVKYLGNWNANTGAVVGNDLRSPAGRAYRKGDYYICAVAGNKVPNPSGSGFLTSTITFAVGDWIIFTVGAGADAWEKVDNTDAVTSVDGQTGAVNLESKYAQQTGTYPNMTVGNAAKAQRDSEGNNIVATYAKKTFLQNYYFARTGVLTANLVTDKPAPNDANYLATTTTNTTIDFNSAQKLTISRVLLNDLEVSNQNAVGMSLAFAFNRNAQVEFAARVFVDDVQVSQGQAFGLRAYNGSNDFTNVNELTASIALDLIQGVQTFSAGQTIKIEIVTRQNATNTLNTRYFCGVSVSGIERNSFAKLDISNTVVNTNQIAAGAVTEPKLSPDVQAKLNAGGVYVEANPAASYSTALGSIVVGQNGYTVTRAVIAKASDGEVFNVTAQSSALVVGKNVGVVLPSETNAINHNDIVVMRFTDENAKNGTLITKKGDAGQYTILAVVYDPTSGGGSGGLQVQEITTKTFAELYTALKNLLAQGKEIVSIQTRDASENTSFSFTMNEVQYGGLAVSVSLCKSGELIVSGFVYTSEATELLLVDISTVNIGGGQVKSIPYINGFLPTNIAPVDINWERAAGCTVYVYFQ